MLDLGHKQPNAPSALMRSDFRNLARLVLTYADRLVPNWLPDGRRSGNEWIAHNPMRVDRRLGSFKVNLRSGRWADFATGDVGGDLISLYAYLNRLSQAQAARLIARELGHECS